MEITNGGEILVQALARQGVKKVFSIIGGQMGTMYDAIGRHPDMEVITPRSEASAALMACGYTASTGTPCVSMATVGAGVVYETAGLIMAWLDYLPVLSIAPQVQSYKMKPHQENLQACDQDLLFAPFTKFNAIGYHAKRLPQLVDRALREALAGIPGPVHLDVPVDILFER
jgi:acetolactate synthase-1/2/3 large subunit